MVLIKKFEYTNIQLPAGTKVILSQGQKLFNWNEYLITVEEFEKPYFQALRYIKENNYFVKTIDVIDTDGTISSTDYNNYIGHGDATDIYGATYLTIESTDKMFYIDTFYVKTLFTISSSSTGYYDITFTYEDKRKLTWSDGLRKRCGDNKRTA